MSKRKFYLAAIAVVCVAALLATVLQYRIVSDGAYMDRLEITGDVGAQWLSFVFALIVTGVSLALILKSVIKRKRI